MNEENVIRFKMLGPFSHVLPDGEDPLVQSVSLKAGKKTLSFLQYLIMNHARDVSSEELIEQFWPEGSRAPEVALRQTLFKVRNVLERMFLEKSDLLITLPGGGYTWNHDVFLELDVERFEEACLNARRTLGEEKCELLLQAVSLYKGEFLSGNDNEWARVLRQYYQTLYLDACKILLPLLYKEEKWVEILNICGQAYHVDFTVEDFTVYQMQAFFCTFEIFQNIVALEKRHIERSGQESSIAIVSLEKEAVPVTDARRLERILLEGLRTGDPVARPEANSYIVMLTGATVERASYVMGRIDREFHKTYRHSKAHLNYQIAPLNLEGAG